MKKNSDLRQRILELIISQPDIRVSTLARQLAIPKREKRALRGCLKSLVLSGEVVALRGGRYRPAKKRTVRGVIAVNRKGEGFVTMTSGEVVNIPRGALDSALNGDTVAVLLDRPPRKGRRRAKREEPKYGKVVKVIERGNKQVIGYVKNIRGKMALIPSNSRIKGIFDIVSSEDIPQGTAVAATILSYDEKRNIFLVEVDENFGPAVDSATIATMVLAEHEIEREFPKNIDLSQCHEPGEDDFAGRKDLRGLLTVTIDGAEAQDFDDALSLETGDDGQVTLYAHIADVTHYVRPSSRLDDEARERATSIYYPGGAVPMLPRELSSNICSLLPNKERLTLTCEMVLNNVGKIVRSRVYPAVIESDARLTYVEAEDALNGALDLSPEVIDLLFKLRRVVELRRQKRKERGGLIMFLPEPLPVLDEKGRLVDITKQEPLYSYQLVEECMLAANESVAVLAEKEDLPIMFRHHPPPDDKKILDLRRLLDTFGIESDDCKLSTPLGWQRLLERLTAIEGHEALLPFVIRTQMRASYADIPSGHFGLALKLYCHFTSPIRRYPDLWTHRVIKAFVKGKKVGPCEGLESWADHCSTREQRAEAIDREVLRRLTVPFVERFKGCKFDGLITSVHPFGFFVEVDKPFFDGMVPVGDLIDDYYRYAEGRGYLQGVNQKRVFAVGDRLSVVLTRTDRFTNQVDFIPADLYS